MPPKKKPIRRKLNVTGLNKKERSQVVQLAKKSVQTIAEKKFMNNNDESLQQQIPHPLPNKVVSCIGYSTTVNAQPDDGAFQYPNGHDIKEMMCLRPFFDTTAYEDLRQYAPDGKEIRPVSCQTRWRLDRDFTKITAQFRNVDGGDDPAPADTGLAMPILCRMVRVNPILTSTSTECNPAEDAFVNSYGQAFGVDSVNDAGQSVFGEEECLFSRLNTRRYKVIQDTKFVLQPGAVVNWTGAASSTNGRAGIANVTPSYKRCERYLNTSHMLTARKNGKCFYEDPAESTTTNATTGNKREYILFHFFRQGSNLLTGASSAIDAPMDINISVTNVTKFIDV